MLQRVMLVVQDTPTIIAVPVPVPPTLGLVLSNGFLAIVGVIVLVAILVVASAAFGHMMGRRKQPEASPGRDGRDGRDTPPTASREPAEDNG